MSGVAAAFAQALQDHQAGNLRQAEQLYRQILRAAPDHADSYHMLGVLAYQVGRFDQAVAWIGQALALNPGAASYHTNLGNALLQLGRPDQALGHFRSAIRLQPDCPDPWNNAGALLTDQGQPAEAVAHLQHALRLRPEFPEAHNNLGNAFKEQGQLDEAAAQYREALRLRPAFAEAHSNLALVLVTQSKPAEAVASFRQALRLKPDYPEAHNGLGNALKAQLQLDEAAAHYHEALRLRPAFAEAHNNLGLVLTDQGRPAEAAEHLRQALRLRPDFPQAYNNLGNALKELRQPDEAAAQYRAALRLRPALPDAHYNLGLLLELQGRVEEAVACHRQAIALQPDNPRFHSALLLPLHYLAEVRPPALLVEHRGWAERHADPLTAAARPHANDPDPERRLRVGFLSPDLRQHPVAFFLEPILNHLDRARFHVTCYANVPRPDAVTVRLRGLADAWRDVAGRPDGAVAELIRADAIDLLVDPTGHTADHRLLVFARKPAPVQLAHFGYPDTTDLAAMDYRLTDPYADPPGRTEAFHTEELVRLPEVAWCYQPSAAPDVSPLPAPAAGRVTFGSLNRLAKVTPQAVALWSRLLGAVPGSRLLLLTGAGVQADRRLRDQFRECGVDGERLRLLGRLPRDRYLEQYRQIDIALDPFPYNGGVTSCDALWMGVPVVTLAGDSYASRQGVSILSNLGLADWVAGAPEDYAALAARRANDLEGLNRLRAGLRERMRGSPVCDGARFTRHLEAAYRTLWRRWCARGSNH